MYGGGEAVSMNTEISRVLLVTHGRPQVTREVLREVLDLLTAWRVEIVAPPSEWGKHEAVLKMASGSEVVNGQEDLKGVGLCLVLGGDGTMLRAFHLTRGLSIPVAGINLGRVGFLTTVEKHQLAEGLDRLLTGQFVQYQLLGLEAQLADQAFSATNDVVASKGDSSHACALSLTINGVTMFDVSCDGVVVATPAGSSAYSLAAGGPLLGISVKAYVISFVAAHAVGVRPVVAAPEDVLEIINTDSERECYLDVDGERVAKLMPGGAVCIRTTPAMVSLALLRGDSLYHHFRDRLL